MDCRELLFIAQDVLLVDLADTHIMCRTFVKLCKTGARSIVLITKNDLQKSKLLISTIHAKNVRNPMVWMVFLHEIHHGIT